MHGTGIAAGADEVHFQGTAGLSLHNFENDSSLQ